MASPTKPLFIYDAYLMACEAKVIGINDRGGIILDQTNFCATSGGQPGDSGTLELEDGSTVTIATTINGESKADIILVPDTDQVMPKIGDTVICHIDWDRRYKLMQMHTACHLLSVACPFPITSASVGEAESRIDFDLPDASVSKEDVTRDLMALVEANHPIYTQWITEDELDTDPSIIRSKNVKPPKGAGKIRLVCIGENASVDSQPCGGTHVTETAEVGPIHIGKIEKKGRENRRFRIRFGPAPT